MASTRLADAAFVETIKASEPLSTVLLAALILGEVERAQTYASLLPIVFGVALACSGSASYSNIAVGATLCANLGFSGRTVYTKRLKKDHPTSNAVRSDLCLFYHVSLLGLLLLLPLLGWQEAAALWRTLGETAWDDRRWLLLLLSLNGAAYMLYNQLSFMVLSRVATSTHAVINVTRRVFIISVSAAVFGVRLTPLNCAGVVVALLGVVAFGLSKSVVPAQRPAALNSLTSIKFV